MSYRGMSGGKDKQRRRRAVVRRDGGGCRQCGAARNLTLDHIIPCSRGGSNAIENLQLLCVACNQAKADTLPQPRDGDVTRRADNELERAEAA